MIFHSIAAVVATAASSTKEGCDGAAKANNSQPTPRKLPVSQAEWRGCADRRSQHKQKGRKGGKRLVSGQALGRKVYDSGMNHTLIIVLVVFAVILAGAFSGSKIRDYLPKNHLTNDTKNLVNVSTAVVATMAALVLGLLISNANTRFWPPVSPAVWARRR